MLIEFNRGLIGHPADPMFEALSQKGIKLKQLDRTAALHKITRQAIEAFQQRYLS